jgi:hypothetical protein
MKLWPNWYRPMKRIPSFILLERAAQRLGVSVDDVKVGSRDHEIVAARAAIARLMKEDGKSFPTIARVLNYKEHSAVVHLVNTYPHKTRHPEFYRAMVIFLRSGNPTAQLQARAAPIPAEPEPQTVPQPARIATLKPKNNFAPDEGEEADGGHRFHAGIASKNGVFLAALGRAA